MRLTNLPPPGDTDPPDKGRHKDSQNNKENQENSSTQVVEGAIHNSKRNDIMTEADGSPKADDEGQRGHNNNGHANNQMNMEKQFNTINHHYGTRREDLDKAESQKQHGRVTTSDTNTQLGRSPGMVANEDAGQQGHINNQMNMEKQFNTTNHHYGNRGNDLGKSESQKQHGRVTSDNTQSGRSPGTGMTTEEHVNNQMNMEKQFNTTNHHYGNRGNDLGKSESQKQHGRVTSDNTQSGGSPGTGMTTEEHANNQMNMEKQFHTTNHHYGTRGNDLGKAENQKQQGRVTTSVNQNTQGYTQSDRSLGTAGMTDGHANNQMNMEKQFNITNHHYGTRGEELGKSEGQKQNRRATTSDNQENNQSSNPTGG